MQKAIVSGFTNARFKKRERERETECETSRERSELDDDDQQSQVYTTTTKKESVVGFSPFFFLTFLSFTHLHIYVYM